jgi:hypothetical protein
MITARTVPVYKSNTTTAVSRTQPKNDACAVMVSFDRRRQTIYSAVVETSSQSDQIRARAEFAALRTTIRQRGTARVVLLPVIFIGWGALTVAAAAVITVALSTLVPLLVLAAGFEAVFALHMNVERLGRYLQVFHERHAEGWEQVAITVGQQFSAGPDPLFVRLFILATSVNFFPAALGGEPWEVLLIGVCHFALIYRVRKAQTFAAGQRADDLKRFETLRATLTGAPRDLQERSSAAARPSD